MEVGIRKEERTLVLSISGRMDAVTAPEFDDLVKKQLERGESHFILDLSDLEYISSAGLRSMLIHKKNLYVDEGVLVLCGLHDMVKEVFKVSGFNAIFTIFDSLEEAIKNT